MRFPTKRYKLIEGCDDVDLGIIFKSLILRQQEKEYITPWMSLAMEWKIQAFIEATAKEDKRRQDIEDLILAVREEISKLWLWYNNKDERRYAKLLLDSKDFKAFALNNNKTMTDTVLDIIKAWLKIDYFKGPCNSLWSIRFNYADIYSKYKEYLNKKALAAINTDTAIWYAKTLQWYIKDVAIRRVQSYEAANSTLMPLEMLKRWIKDFEATPSKYPSYKDILDLHWIKHQDALT